MSVTSLNIVVLSPEIRHPKQTNKQTNRKLLHFSKLEFRSTSSNKGCLYPSELWWWGEGRAVGTAQCRGSQPTWHAFSTSPPPPPSFFLLLVQTNAIVLSLERIARSLAISTGVNHPPFLLKLSAAIAHRIVYNLPHVMWRKLFIEKIWRAIILYFDIYGLIFNVNVFFLLLHFICLWK